MPLPLNLEQIFNIATSGMSAESIRMNTIASNLANTDSIGADEKSTYHAKYPIFTEVKNNVDGVNDNDQPVGGVRVTKIAQNNHPLEKRYDPENPNADKNGFIYMTDVNPVSEMTNMISSSKEYQADVDVMNTTKNLILATVKVIENK